MAREVRCGLIQARCELSPEEHSLEEIKQAMLDKHEKLIARAAGQNVQILCLQEIFSGPYFCAEQDIRWYPLAEPVPDGPTVRLMQDLAKKHQLAMVVPVFDDIPLRTGFRGYSYG